VRAFHGLWIGLLVGLVLWAIVSAVERRLYPAPSAPQEEQEEEDWDWPDRQESL